MSIPGTRQAPGAADGRHILNADLESNTRVRNWAGQYRYWGKRLESCDDYQCEAWRLIAKYLEVYHLANRSYPNTRRLLLGWWAADWKDEKARIEAFCKAHNATPALPAYIEARATEGRRPSQDAAFELQRLDEEGGRRVCPDRPREPVQEAGHHGEAACRAGTAPYDSSYDLTRPTARIFRGDAQLTVLQCVATVRVLTGLDGLLIT